MRTCFIATLFVVGAIGCHQDQQGRWDALEGDVTGDTDAVDDGLPVCWYEANRGNPDEGVVVEAVDALIILDACKVDR